MSAQSDVIPRLIRRNCGGWIALSPHENKLKIGILAETEKEAVARFAQSFSIWNQNLQKDRVV